jgi:F-type H+-transporting ATPase subunit epsilon
MADRIQLEVVTPTGPVVSQEVDIVTAPGVDGEFGVLANHAPFLSTIKIGTLTYKQGNNTEVFMVSGGFCEVSNNKVTFLVESAERGKDIDVNRALRAKERAEKRLAAAQRKQETVSQTRAEAALQRSLARLKVSQSTK